MTDEARDAVIRNAAELGIVPVAFDIVGKVVKVGDFAMLEDPGGARWNIPRSLLVLEGTWIRIEVTRVPKPDAIYPNTKGIE